MAITKTLYSKLTVFALALTLILCACHMCAVRTGPPSNALHVPTKGFVLVDVTTTYTLTDCVNPKAACQDLAWPGPQKTQHRGSGAVVKHANNKTYLLTAAHVCGDKNIKKFVTLNEITFKMKTVVEIGLTDYYGGVHQATVVHADHVNDICLLESNGTWGSAVPIAENMPKRGSRVYNMAAPYGIHAPKNVLLFDGYFTGYYQVTNAFFTVPTRPGSSGSPILNADGEIVSIIHSSMMALESLGLGCLLEHIHTIVNSYIPDSIITTGAKNTEVILEVYEPDIY